MRRENVGASRRADAWGHPAAPGMDHGAEHQIDVLGVQIGGEMMRDSWHYQRSPSSGQQSLVSIDFENGKAQRFRFAQQRGLS